MATAAEETKRGEKGRLNLREISADKRDREAWKKRTAIFFWQNRQKIKFLISSFFSLSLSLSLSLILSLVRLCPQNTVSILPSLSDMFKRRSVAKYTLWSVFHMGLILMPDDGIHCNVKNDQSVLQIFWVPESSKNVLKTFLGSPL